jgi:multidrug efflux pump subunit AcrB
MPIGTELQSTNNQTKVIEAKIDQALAPYKASGVVESVLSQIGENTNDPAAPPEPGATPNKARLTVAFVSADKRNGLSTQTVMNDIRDSLKGYPGVNLIVDRNQDGPPTGKPINLELFADDVEMNALTTVANDVLGYLKAKNVPGVEELQKNVSADVQQDLVKIDREAARRFGVSTYDIAMGLRTSLYGNEVSKLKRGEDEYPIMLRLAEQYRQNQDALMNQLVTFRDMNTGKLVQVPVSAVAQVVPSSTYNAIKRKNEKRTITIYSNVLAGYNPNEIVQTLKDAMASYKLPEGFGYRFTGEQEEQAAASAFLGSALGYAVALVFFIIVLQFNSLISPIIIMTTVLFSIIGVLLGYVLTGQNLVIIMTGIGVISLAGVVVNNAIVLLDYAGFLQERRRQEFGRELTDQEVLNCIAEAGKTRLRPVLLTAITTVFGLVPLAIGFNFDFTTLITDMNPNIYWGGDSAAMWGALSWTVVYGLVFATFLTLVVLPLMYWLVYRAKIHLATAFAYLGVGKKATE